MLLEEVVSRVRAMLLEGGSMDWSAILSLSILLGVLVAARVAAIVFQPKDAKSDLDV